MRLFVAKRPKILVAVSKDEKIEEAQKTHDNYLIKFRSPYDPKDIGPIEYAYHLMAKAAGLDVPQAKLFKSKKCDGYFGVKRFDRQKSEFKHMHTIAGLLHADHRIPTLDYKILLKATLHLTKDMTECEKQFRHMAFNIFTHNRDDHSKNFSFLMDEEGKWKVSPAYDLTFSSGPMGQHSTTVLGEGKNPTIEHILKLAEIISIKPKRAKEIVDEVRAAVSKWEKFADKTGIGKRSTKNIEATLKLIAG